MWQEYAGRTSVERLLAGLREGSAPRTGWIECWSCLKAGRGVQRGEAFGFHRPGRGGGPDVFAHYSNISGYGFRELAEGESVTFDVTQGQKGSQAENIIRG